MKPIQIGEKLYYIFEDSKHKVFDIVCGLPNNVLIFSQAEMEKFLDIVWNNSEPTNKGDESQENITLTWYGKEITFIWDELYEHWQIEHFDLFLNSTYSNKYVVFDSDDVVSECFDTPQEALDDYRNKLLIGIETKFDR